jgi:hypothetical protein
MRSAGVGRARIFTAYPVCGRAMAGVIHELPHSVADRRCCNATLRQCDSCSADGQGFGILELVGSHRHRQL